MAINFSLPIENAANYPVPAIYSTPKLLLQFITLNRQINLGAEHCVVTKNGRGAIAIAGETLKNNSKNIILIPTYHCPALVEPFIWLDYQIHFYPVTEELEIDLSVLENLIDLNEATHCIVIRYFGFAQNIEAVKELLVTRNIQIIEDCAHAFFKFCDIVKNSNNTSVAAICSINKLLPSIDGGILYLPNKVLPQPTPKSWLSEIKGLAHIIGISPWLVKLKPKKAPVQPPKPMPAIKKYRYFKPQDEFAASYRHTKFLAEHSNMQKMIDTRRQHFEYLYQGLKNCPAGRPLFHRLQPDDVPYVFPFLLNDAKHFKQLRLNGIQILRWEELAESTCAVSDKFKQNLVQLPCHHQMTRLQLDWLINTMNLLE